MKFTVTIYHGDDSEDDVPACRDKLMHSASRLGSTTVTAKDEREAAAKAWIRLIAPPRVERMKELKTPPVVITYTTDLAAVTADMRDSALGGVCCELFNRCEVWYFCIKP